MSILRPSTRCSSRISVAIAAALLFSFPVLAEIVDLEPRGAQILPAVKVIGEAPESALTWETDPKVPRQPVPASDGADYLKTIPGFSACATAAPTGILSCAACLARAWPC
jgi:iron complex outermembrane receptor protein